PRRLRGLSGAAGRRSARAGELRLRPARALPFARGQDVPPAGVHAAWGPGMIAVIFEVEPAEGQEAAYLDIAADLRVLLDEVEGFVSVERFRSLTNPGKVLSLSFFEDEAALARWRNNAAHRRAQAMGRGGVFRDYRL